MSDFYEYVTQPSNQRNNLIDAIDLILEFNETIQLDLVWKHKNQRIKIRASDFNCWKQSRLSRTLCHQKKFIFFLCMYKMYLISAEGYKKAKADFLTINTIGEIWVNMKDVGSGMSVKNISNLILKEIYGICETKKSYKKTN